MALTGWIPALVGALSPYLLLWVSRSRRAREGARRLAATGWPRRAGVAATAFVGLALGASVGRPLPLGWVPLAAAGGWWTYAVVDTLVAAGEIRRYPSDTALHFDLDRPATWPATALCIHAAWAWLLRTRHRWLGAAWLAGALAWPLAVPGPVALALAAFGLVMAASCAPVPGPGQERARRRLGPRLDVERD